MDEYNVCSVTSDPSESSSRRALSYKDSSVLLNNWEMNLKKIKCTSSWRGTELVKVVWCRSSVSIVLCILIVYHYIFSAFPTSSVLAIRSTVDSLISGHHWGKDYCPLIRGVRLLESLWFFGKGRGNIKMPRLLKLKLESWHPYTIQKDMKNDKNTNTNLIFK